MQIGVVSNSPQYRAALIEYIATFGKSIREAITIQGRLLGQRLVAFTPPKTQKQGRDRVRKDIQKIILGLDDEWFEKTQEMVKGDPSVVRAFVDKNGVPYGVDADKFLPNGNENDFDKFHQSMRDRRGRVAVKDSGNAQDRGGWKYLPIMAAPRESVDEYIKGVQKGVGRGKGGWANGTLKLGGKVAGWISGHANAGAFVDSRGDSNPSIEFINKSEWASGGDEDRIMDNAINARIRDINKSIQLAVKGKTFFK